MEENLENLESRVLEMYDYQLDPDFIKDKLTDLETKQFKNRFHQRETKWNTERLWKRGRYR